MNGSYRDPRHFRLGGPSGSAVSDDEWLSAAERSHCLEEALNRPCLTTTAVASLRPPEGSRTPFGYSQNFVRNGCGAPRAKALYDRHEGYERSERQAAAERLKSMEYLLNAEAITAELLLNGRLGSA